MKILIFLFCLALWTYGQPEPDLNSYDQYNDSVAHAKKVEDSIKNLPKVSWSDSVTEFQMSSQDSARIDSLEAQISNFDLMWTKKLKQVVKAYHLDASIEQQEKVTEKLHVIKTYCRQHCNINDCQQLLEILLSQTNTQYDEYGIQRKHDMQIMISKIRAEINDSLLVLSQKQEIKPTYCKRNKL